MPLFHFELGRLSDGSPFRGDAKIRADTVELALARLRAILPDSIAWQSPTTTQPGEVLNIYLDSSKIRAEDHCPEESIGEPENDPLETLAPGLGHFLASRAQQVAGESAVCTSRDSDLSPIAGKTLRVEEVIYRPGSSSVTREVQLPVVQLRCPEGERWSLAPGEIFVVDASAAAALSEIAAVFEASRLRAEGPFHLAELSDAGGDVYREFFRRALARDFPGDFAAE